MTMAYKGIMGRDTGMSTPMGITYVACLVAAGCSAAAIGRPSAGIGRVISGEIERSWLESPEILGDPSCWLGAIEDPCVGRKATIEPQASKCKAAGR